MIVDILITQWSGIIIRMYGATRKRVLEEIT